MSHAAIPMKHKLSIDSRLEHTWLPSNHYVQNWDGERSNCVLIPFNPFVTSGTHMSHLQRVFSSPLGITVSYFFSMLSSTLKSVYSVEPVRMHFPVKQLCTNDTVCNAACSIAHSIICKWLFRGKMHSDWFNGIDRLQGR